MALCTFNGQAYVGEQIKSILEQSHPPDEIIVCDDCSHDRTIEKVRVIMQDTEIPIHLFVNSCNLGYVRNFEKAIGLCNGDIIFLSDQDDVWYNDKIETMVQPFIEDGDVGLVYSDGDIVDQHCASLGVSIFNTRKYAKLHSGCDRQVLDVVRHVDLKGCLIAFRADLRSVFLPIPENAKKVGWGHDHWIATIAYAVTGVHVVNRALILYRRHSEHYGRDKIGRSSFLADRKEVAISDLFAKITYRKLANKSAVIASKEHLMLNRLYEIRKKFPDMVMCMPRLDLYIEEIEKYMVALETRSGLRQLYLPCRVPHMLKMICKGWYVKYFRGFKSVKRDLLAPRKSIKTHGQTLATPES